MNLKRLILFILIANISILSFAQEFNIGTKIGYGSSVYKRQSDGEKTSKYFTQKYGLSIEFSPYFSKFYIYSGAEFEFNKLENSMMIPLSLRITIGDDFRVFFDGGGYYNVNLKNKTADYSFKNDLGLRAGLGFQIYFGRNWIMEAAYIGKYGFSTRLEEEIHLPGDQIIFEKYRIIFHQIELNVKYRF